MLPGHTIQRIRYFTSLVWGAPDDPRKPQRQLTTIRALQTTPNLSVHYRHFVTHPVRMRLARPPAKGARDVEVIRNEEKGSDVNLATVLLADGFDGEYELAVILSNDSDLAEPVRVMRARGYRIGVLCPQREVRRMRPELMKAATFHRPVRESVLPTCQFAPVLTDGKGQTDRPAGW